MIVFLGSDQISGSLVCLSLCSQDTTKSLNNKKLIYRVLNFAILHENSLELFEEQLSHKQTTLVSSFSS